MRLCKDGKTRKPLSRWAPRPKTQEMNLASRVFSCQTWNDGMIQAHHEVRDPQGRWYARSRPSYCVTTTHGYAWAHALQQQRPFKEVEGESPKSKKGGYYWVPLAQFGCAGAVQWQPSPMPCRSQSFLPSTGAVAALDCPAMVHSGCPCPWNLPCAIAVVLV